MYQRLIRLFSDRTFGLVVGLSFTTLVVGLIVYGNFFASSSHQVNFTWEQQPTLYVCDTAPDWAKPGKEPLTKALAFWEAHGWTFENIEVGPCSESCMVKNDKGKTLTVTCNKGMVTLDLMDQWFSTEHAGLCRYPAGVDVMRGSHWATILVPGAIFGSDEINEEGSGPTLPLDAEALVLAHEVGHCLAGLGHNQGPPVGCVRLNSKTGALMNPSLYNSGWVDEALPAPPAWN
jgi:hypothetical protein